MSILAQWIAVALIIACCAGYMLRRLFKRKDRRSGCCDCTNCDIKNRCNNKGRFNK